MNNIRDRHVAVIGLGYIGLTLALTSAKVGFCVTGVDANKHRLDRLMLCDSYVHEPGINELLRDMQTCGRFKVSDSIPRCDIAIICVGTPIRNHLPNTDDVVAVTKSIIEHAAPGCLVIVRSTVPIGTTRKIILPILESSPYSFNLAVAPDRTIEGNALAGLRTLPQIIGALNLISMELATELFKTFALDIIPVESLEAAEMCKLMQNSYRDVRFGFANEMSSIALNHNINIRALINSANYDYPRDPLPLPSPGVGGPCLTKDTYMLDAVIADKARYRNVHQPKWIAERIIEQLNLSGRDPSRCSVAVCGIAFKGCPETTDMRGSPALDLIHELHVHAGSIVVHDWIVSARDMEDIGLVSLSLEQAITHRDVVIFMNNHQSYKTIDRILFCAMRPNPVIFDGWGMFDPKDITAIPGATYMGISTVFRSNA